MRVLSLPHILIVALTVFGTSIFLRAQTPDGLWTEISDSALQQRTNLRLIVPSSYKTFRLNTSAMRSALAAAPEEFTESSGFSPSIISLPMPNGTLGRFRVEHSLVVEHGLLDKYPELGQTYRARGVDDPTATARLDFLPKGFHAMVLAPTGTVMIDPYAEDDLENYITYFKRDAPRKSEFVCEFDEQNFLDQLLSADGSDARELIPDAAGEDVSSGTQLRSYRLALAATNEYAVAVGGNTVAGTVAAEVLIMNRVNGVYERDLAIHMNIHANVGLITFAGDNMTCGAANNEVCTAANDPYSNTSGSTMLGQNQSEIDATIGAANYDIGHVFSTGGGGVASLSVPCGSSKARGVTGLSNPVGDPFAIDYVAHEMGHQWGANHTFNGGSGSCSGGNRSAGSAYEPGSGITIMAYAGICSTQDLDRHSIDTFHVKSLEAIVTFSQSGNGNSCAATTASGNTPPTVSVVGGPSFNIPKQTPFILTASATDVNGDSITYDWQEYDLGLGTTAVPNSDSDGSVRPIFRPYLPTIEPYRYFPSLPFILNNANVPPASFNCGRATLCLTGELLPAIARTMTFQVIARDNRANAGGINTATATVNVDGNSGPFAVTFPNTPTTIVVSDIVHSVTWNPANTTASPVNAANVRILLSTDGGQTFPTVLAANTPNDGTQPVPFPGITTSTARVKIEAVNNIFFDVSDTNFSITFAPSPFGQPVFDFDNDGKTDISIFRPSVGEWWYQRSSDGQIPAAQFGTSTDTIVPADFTGDGKTDIAFWRPSDGSWFVLRSEDSTYFAFPFGAAGDKPIPADFDGDGKSDPSVFRPSNSTWYINRSTGGTTITTFGATGDVPVPADYDGDAKADIAIYRPNGPSGGEWWMSRSTAGLLAVQFGSGTDKVVPGDYTGDGRADVAVWQQATGFWFVLRSENLSYYSIPFGSNGDVPVPGDYDGDGKFDQAVFRPSAATWFINRSTAGVLIQAFGQATDKPVPSAFIN